MRRERGAMNRLAMLKFMAPLVGTSLLLALLGASAAWYVQRQQVAASEIIDHEVHGLVAIHDLYIVIREVRYQLNQYLRLGDEARLDEVVAIEPQAKSMLESSRQLAKRPQQQEQLAKVAGGYEKFVQELAAARERPPGERRELLEKWANTEINALILNPAQECVVLNEQIVARTNEVNRQTSNRLTQAFLLLGLTGSVAGVLMGLTIARSLQRSLRELHGFVAGAAGRLEGSTEPFPAPPTGELIELRMGAKFLERRAIQVVEQLQQRELEVIRNEQLAAVGQLAAGLAHELRNPLMPMKMLVQAARADAAGKGLTGRQLQILEEEISRMESSIQAFLDFVRPPTVQKQRSDLRSVVSDAVDLLAGRLNEQEIAIICRLPDAPCLVEFDPIQIKQVILNLLLNALDELHAKGEVLITVAAATDATDRPGMRVTVADNGPGIPADLLPRIFEPFVTRKDLGTGLGLTICHRIIEAHGGKLTAGNRLSGGAEFSIWLPL
jgi:two-component system sensor histidine kinase HydH